MTPAEAMALEQLGLLERTAQHGERVEYKLTPAARTLLHKPHPLRRPCHCDPNNLNRPSWAFEEEPRPRGKPMLVLLTSLRKAR